MLRILVASLLGLAGFALYIGAAVALADRLSGTHWIIQLLYFASAGVLWTIPARSLMIWAARG